ncbi:MULTISPECIES: helix-turn-helix domain-containing protein [Neobacillus]|nr:helix-turn-helix transcriptional regulator [Neobacillus citreus]
MSLAEKLKKLRDRQNWSQDTLASMMNLHRSTISRFENGRSVPTYQTLLQFAEIFKIDKDYLLGELNQGDFSQVEPGFLTKETLENPDLAIIYELLQKEPELKKALVELHLMAPKRRAFYADMIASLVRANKRHRDKI